MKRGFSWMARAGFRVHQGRMGPHWPWPPPQGVVSSQRWSKAPEFSSVEVFPPPLVLMCSQRQILLFISFISGVWPGLAISRGTGTTNTQELLQWLSSPALPSSAPQVPVGLQGPGQGQIQRVGGVRGGEGEDRTNPGLGSSPGEGRG